MQIDPHIPYRNQSETKLPDEGLDIEMIAESGHTYHGYFVWSGEYKFYTHEGHRVIRIKEWEYE